MNDPARKPWKTRKGDRRKPGRLTPSDLRRESARVERRTAEPNHAAVIAPGSTPRLGPPICRRTPGGEQ